MLRGLLAVLLLANAVFFAWTRGALSPLLPPPDHGRREPERLTAQLRPETVVVLSPLAASAAVRAARDAACLQAGPLSDEQLAATEAVLAGAGVAAAAIRRRSETQPALWVVFVGPFPDAAALQSKEDELRTLRLDFEPLADDRAPQPGLALGRHGDREAAEQALVALQQQGLRGARVIELPARAQPWLRVEVPEADLRRRLSAGDPLPTGVHFEPCTPAR
jgi:hypothetical protein